ncbi:MAG: YebC/PmpR family DNA-binding transcriptional regulator [SAR202 cluster bacterium]|jgi:YebC/PmpR family DNA-binding regulatory protein|nr:YebC/PmpR family DNA-binding transcriptional regulator [Chloroflexota bacterium]MDP7231741.1 YebC/PmpR family DNA-binding transcriptional regulator [Dehalococcoidia bacterium]MDP7613214.1 YebC/PmpR family DNA-binding transcriptional regulator [Dehalococcoidia bacterium]MQG47198.1 YebC/PmpR family DNA-binding transcriptional regulator [SAR202 cluster bacterium]|tara:strand:- start:1337 stop:2095 length:759 start_codon:yes stop_codon:yes gene_type:complete
MSGHSKWSTIKHKKGAQDARRGQLFTKLSREITVAAKSGDQNPDMNFRLRLAVDNAKSQNMPKENIERAIIKGSGSSDKSDTLFEITYEAYGPGGVGIIINVLTDNKNRSASLVRSLITRNGGSLAGSGSVAWNFLTKGLVTVTVLGEDPERLALEVMDEGIEEIDIDGESVDVTSGYEEFSKIKEFIQKLGYTQIERAEIIQLPTSTVDLDDSQSIQTLRLLDSLEELDDVTKIFSNANFTDIAMEEYANS